MLENDGSRVETPDEHRGVICPPELMPYLWKKGVSANPAGRPKGARVKLEDRFLKELYASFKEGGGKAIRDCMRDKPDVYLNVIAKVMPRHIDVKADESLADLADGLHAVADFLSAFAAEERGSDIEGSVSDGPVLLAGVRAEEA